ncbi:MAG: YicC family protein [Clostridiales bacterium]|nr:YicC family protein [Clostridiales bacterium]
MIKSMTGYGRAEQSSPEMDVTVELKSVNHRYLELSARAPRNYSFLEERLKNYLQQRVSRGKLDVYVSIDMGEEAGRSGVTVELNRPLADAYAKALTQLADAYDLSAEALLARIPQYPDVFSVRKQALDEETVWAAVEPAAAAALEAFVRMRETEGAKMREDLLERLDAVLRQVEYVEARSPETAKAYRERIEQKVRELIGDAQVDEQRLLTETAIFADKVAVAEETVRLRSHMDQMKQLLDSGEPVGRKLDFLVQEMNREANTIGSKAQDVEITRAVVEIKSEIEKIREQIQNIE